MPAGHDLESSYRRQGFSSLAGVDEAGRGPLAGPVVAAAVIFAPDVVIEGIDDSKKLSAPARDRLAVMVREQAVATSLAVVGHEEIDRINILQATHQAMTTAIRGLSIPPDLVLIDGNSYRHPEIKFVNIVDGDALCFSIAAASILAKVERDRIMTAYDAEYPQYGFARHKGYGTREHLQAIRKHGLSPIHRKTFRVQLEIWEGQEKGK